MSDLSNYVAQRVFDQFQWLNDHMTLETMSGAIENGLLGHATRAHMIAQKVTPAKPQKAAKVVYDEGWWRDVMERTRAAVAARNKAAGLDYDAIRRENDEEIAAVAASAIRHRPYLKDGTGYGASLRPVERSIDVSRVAFTYLYKVEVMKAKAVKQMRVPALCYWPGGVLPPGFTLLTCTGPITPRGTFDYFTSAAYKEDLAIAKQGKSFRYAT